MKTKGVVGEEWLLGDLKARIRGVAQGRDRALHLLTDSGAGSVLAPK